MSVFQIFFSILRLAFVVLTGWLKKNEGEPGDPRRAHHISC